MPPKPVTALVAEIERFESERVVDMVLEVIHASSNGVEYVCRRIIEVKSALHRMRITSRIEDDVIELVAGSRPCIKSGPIAVSAPTGPENPANSCSTVRSPSSSI